MIHHSNFSVVNGKCLMLYIRVGFFMLFLIKSWLERVRDFAYNQDF